MQLKRIKFHQYAGLKIVGSAPLKLGHFDFHCDRVSWLTAQVESGGRFGTVINYDGTGITAGIHQCVAVYPNMVRNPKHERHQGPLWKLLRQILELAPETDEKRALFIAIDEKGWRIDKQGVLTDFTGRFISGAEIRDCLSGSPDGVMPANGTGRDRAERWIVLFHDLFSHPSTHEIQLQHGVKDFMWKAERTKFRFSKKGLYNVSTIDELIYAHRFSNGRPGFEMGHELDLAMSAFWSNHVNAPAVALQAICAVVDRHTRFRDNLEFAKDLIKVLGISTYGRWYHGIPTGRYQRTRNAAKLLWSTEFFTGDGALMPKEFDE